MKQKILDLRKSIIREEFWIRIFLVIFFIVGVTGLSLPLFRELFLNLTPFAILLSIFFLIIFHEPEPDRKTLNAFAIILVVTWGIEAIGVATGVIFGFYNYGSGLGLKLLDTPLLIGLNWLFLIYVTSCITDRIPVNRVIRIIIASLLMVLYDFIMENVAMDLDMWRFNGGMPPVRNYLAWFVIALIIHAAIKLTGITFRNRIAPFIFVLQSLFFIVLISIFKLSE
jgi:putative membrane protein